MFNRTRVFISSLCLMSLVLSTSSSAFAQKPVPAGDSPLATLTVGPDGLTWKMLVKYDSVVLTVSGPDGQVFRQEFKAGQTPTFSLGDSKNQKPDGQYTYELQVMPVIEPEVRAALVAARQSGNEAEVIAKYQQSGQLPQQAQVQSGSFTIAQGKAIAGGETEPQAAQPAVTGSQPQGQSPNAPADFVIADDLIVQGSECLGFDCVDGESFSFDTLRLKENNTRIKFEDTSAAGFPSNDWQLTANDSASGGANKFSIDDVDGAKTPFTIIAGAPSNSIFVDSGGRLGLGTATPLLKLHLATSDTPAMRLEQNSSGGFTAQTWDVAGNEANFFIRDLTGGSRLPFRIRPGAPTSSIDIAASGNVGIGTANPTTKLHVSSAADGNTIALVENSNSTGLSAAGVFQVKGSNDQLSIVAHGAARTVSRFGLTLGGWTEIFASSGNGLVMGSNIATPLVFGTNNLERMRINSTGNVGIGITNTVDKLQVVGDIRVGTSGTNGCVKNFAGTGIVGTCSSDLRMKKNIVPFTSMLDKVTQLQPVYFQWKADQFPQYYFDGNVQNVGMIAQDVERVLPEMVTTDANGYKAVNYSELPLMLLQALIDLRAEKDTQIKDLQQKNATLQAQNAEFARRLAALEDKVNALAAQP